MGIKFNLRVCFKGLLLPKCYEYCNIVIENIEEIHMENISIDASSFSEQLGIYDFFNVVLAGATFVGGVCIINRNLCNYIWNDFSLQKGLGLILLIYVLGMILQEIGSLLDKKYLNIYKGMNQSTLQGEIDGGYKKETTNKIIKNPLVLEHYRKNADRLLTGFSISEDKNRFELKHVNGYVFSMYQYYVAVCGKDKKVEKLRALFAMSKTLIACFSLLSILSLFALFTNTEPAIAICELAGFSTLKCTTCPDKILFSIVFAVAAVFFVLRAKRTMKNFLLILFGTYDALVRIAEKPNSHSEQAME